MKEQYIKFIEWDMISLNKAVALAESKWYEKYLSLRFIWTWMLKLDSEWDYYTSSDNEQDLIDKGYTELKDPYEFAIGERVLVRDRETDDWIELIYIATKEWGGYAYLVAADWEEDDFEDDESSFEISKYRHITKLNTKTDTITIWSATYNKVEFEEATKDLRPIK